MTWVLAPAAAALWVLTLSRLRVSCPSRAQKVMTATVLTLAAFVTLQVPAVWQGTAAVAGEPAVIIGDHVVTLALQTLILLFVREIGGRGLSTRMIVAGAAAVTVATSALLVTMGATGETITYSSSLENHPGAWPWLAYWSLTIAFGFWALGAGARFYWRFPRQAQARGEALGFLLIGVGTTIALLLTVLRVYVVVSALLGRIAVREEWALQVAWVLAALLLAAIVAGLMARPAASWFIRRSDRRAHHRSLVALEPLWTTLTSAVPNITLDHRAMASLMGTRLSARDKLYRRMIEVNDGLLALAPYTSARVRQDALDQALATGQTPHQAHVVADTVAVQVSLTRYRAREPVTHPSSHLVTRQADDFAAEIDRLSELAAASRHCPLTTTITQRMLEMESA